MSYECLNKTSSVESVMLLPHLTGDLLYFYLNVSLKDFTPATLFSLKCCSQMQLTDSILWSH